MDTGPMSAAAAAAANRKLKACTNCTNAKTKCTPFGNLNNLCERCHRLGKNCTYAEAVIRPKKNRMSSRKQLEDKVDSLVSLLSTIQGGQATSQAINAISPEASHRTGSSYGESPSSGPSGNGCSNLDVSTAPTSNSSNPEEDNHNVLETMPIDMANELFSMYCSTMAPLFPFVTFSPSETVTTMRLNRPLSLKALLAAALFKAANTQRKACYEVTALIKKSMMDRKNYSFDLLQAILIQCAFYHYQFRTQKQELLLFLNFAITLTHELGIDKSPSDNRSQMITPPLRTGSLEGVRCEQWRSFLGTYYEAAVYAQAFRKVKLMQYTKYMDKCRQRLLESIELQTDYSIDVMIGLMNVCMEVNETFTLYDVENSDVSGDLAVKSMVMGFQEKLKSVEEKAQLRRSGPLLPHEQRILEYAKTYTYEVAVHKELWSQSNPQKSTITPTRIQLGWSGLEQAKQLFSTYVDVLPEDLFKFDTGAWTQLLYSLIMLNKFVALDSTDNASACAGPSQWDVTLASKEADIQALGARMIQKIASIVSDERLYDGGAHIMWAFGWIVKNMVNGHKNWLSGCMPSTGVKNPGRTQEPLLDKDAPRDQFDAPNCMAQPPTPTSETTPGGTAKGPATGSGFPGPAFATAFPDVSFENPMDWQDGGVLNNFIWDNMMEGMQTIPFG